MANIAQAGVLAACGALEGYAFHRAGVTVPEVLADQMLFRRMVVMKIFMSAMGTSMVTQSVMRTVSPATFDKSRFYEQASAGLWRVVGGCALLGCGMTLSGSGPTMLPAQLGAGFDSAGRIFAGMLAGGLTFAFAEHAGLVPKATSCPAKVIAPSSSRSGYQAVALPVGVACIAAAAVLEKIFPHGAEAPSGATLLPTLAGVVVGLNQVPLRYITGDGQGGSTSVMRILSICSLGKVPALKKYAVTGLASAGQLIYLYLGMVAGARLAAKEVPSVSSGFGAAREIVGGALMLLGARIANGCTCGLGISGTSELAADGFAGAAAIFGGAIATAVALNGGF
eukprot:TRINITY_DN16222_c0_g1_i1.p1 TRINITY_DN16222_c0_g1~~TRINITY_DN16222_c0_g1_i1.p1  ORF type:complete len:372 (+),score=96.20 TRINITY_DN16222_c0_g1_i1:100-1116(+)